MTFSRRRGSFPPQHMLLIGLILSLLVLLMTTVSATSCNDQFDCLVNGECQNDECKCNQGYEALITHYTSCRAKCDPPNSLPSSFPAADYECGTNSEVLCAGKAKSYNKLDNNCIVTPPIDFTGQFLQFCSGTSCQNPGPKKVIFRGQRLPSLITLDKNKEDKVFILEMRQHKDSSGPTQVGDGNIELAPASLPGIIAPKTTTDSFQMKLRIGKPKCQAVSECKNGEVCSAGFCQAGPGAASCDADGDCGHEWKCDVDAKQCANTKVGCSGKSGCASGEICSDSFCDKGLDDGADCDPNDDKCGQGWACNTDEKCARSCTKKDECKNGERCDSSFCGAVPGDGSCTGDNDCGFQWACTDLQCTNTKTSCSETSDCKNGEVCSAGFCQAGPGAASCDADGDCGHEWKCDVDAKQCANTKVGCSGKSGCASGEICSDSFCDKGPATCTSTSTVNECGKNWECSSDNICFDPIADPQWFTAIMELQPCTKDADCAYFDPFSTCQDGSCHCVSQYSLSSPSQFCLRTPSVCSDDHQCLWYGQKCNEEGKCACPEPGTGFSHTDGSCRKFCTPSVPPGKECSDGFIVCQAPKIYSKVSDDCITQAPIDFVHPLLQFLDSDPDTSIGNSTDPTSVRGSFKLVPGESINLEIVGSSTRSSAKMTIYMFDPAKTDPILSIEVDSGTRHITVPDEISDLKMKLTVDLNGTSTDWFTYIFPVAPRLSPVEKIGDLDFHLDPSNPPTPIPPTLKSGSILAVKFHSFPQDPMTLKALYTFESSSPINIGQFVLVHDPGIQDDEAITIVANRGVVTFGSYQKISITLPQVDTDNFWFVLEESDGKSYNSTLAPVQPNCDENDDISSSIVTCDPESGKCGVDNTCHCNGAGYGKFCQEAADPPNHAVCFNICDKDGMDPTKCNPGIPLSEYTTPCVCKKEFSGLLCAERNICLLRSLDECVYNRWRGKYNTVDSTLSKFNEACEHDCTCNNHWTGHKCSTCKLADPRETDLFCRTGNIDKNCSRCGCIEGFGGKTCDVYSVEASATIKSLTASFFTFTSGGFWDPPLNFSLPPHPANETEIAYSYMSQRLSRVLLDDCPWTDVRIESLTAFPLAAPDLTPGTNTLIGHHWNSIIVQLSAVFTTSSQISTGNGIPIASQALDVFLREWRLCQVANLVDPRETSYIGLSIVEPYTGSLVASDFKAKLSPTSIITDKKEMFVP